MEAHGRIPPELAAPERVARPAEPVYRPTRSGKNPREQGEWGSGIFLSADGESFRQGLALRQYFIDPEGDPILTDDGSPVHFLIDEEGRYLLAHDGEPILGAVDVPSTAVWPPQISD